MGCGIIFPRDYVYVFDGSEPCSPDEDFSGSFSESDDDEMWREKENVELGVTVEVCLP